MKKMMLISALLGGALIAQNQPLANGVYAVEQGTVATRNLVVRQYQGKDIVLDREHFAPLAIDGKPEIHRDPRGSWLTVQLAPEAAKRLEELTRTHISQRIAVVVSDKIVSAPTVRSVIQDGKARITGCENESCDTLLRRLSAQ
jgi:preprotein translocase subunit SecD